MSTLIGSILIFIIGYLLIYFFADILIDKLKDISRIKHVSPFIIGLLILGIDVEETIASIQGATAGLAQISIGNVIGNSIIAFTLCFALPALFFTLKMDHLPRKYLLLMLLLVINATFLVIYGRLTWLFGVIGFIIFAIYIYRNLRIYKKTHTTEIIIKDTEVDDDDDDDDEDNDNGNELNKDDEQTKKEHVKEHDRNEENEDNDMSTPKMGERIQEEKICLESKKKLNKHILIAILSLVLVIIGGNLLIDGVKGLVENTGISEGFYGLIVIAFATNVEEIMLLVKAVQKHQEEIGLGAMIGKKIWNLGLTLGISGMIIQQANYPSIFLWNAIILLMIELYFLYIVIKKQKLTRIDAVVLMVFFILFLILNLIFI